MSPALTEPTQTPAPPSREPRHIHPLHYLMVMGLVVCASLGVIAGWTLRLGYGGRLAPVPISGSISFDEKMEWLWKRTPRRWDVLAAGSSMTLNNLDCQEVAKRLSPGSSLVNCASWSLKMSDTRSLIEYLGAIHQPRAVVVICGPMDFYAGKTGFVKPEQLDSYRTTTSNGMLVARYFDPLYYYERADVIATQRLTRTAYNSLQFDDWGGIPLQVRYPDVDAVRWNEQPQPAKIDPAQYQEFDRLAAWSAARHVRLICAQAPIRSDSFAACDAIGVREHWRKLETILATHGYRFHNLHPTLHLGRDCFADYSHLNEDGARLFTAALLESALDDLNLPAQPTAAYENTLAP